MKLTSINDCTGCGACAQACPRKCIAMIANKDGFLYPQIDGSSCINCGLCNNICPTIAITHASKATSVLAFQSQDYKILSESSSGGMFTTLANKVISKGGVIFGARFDEHWQVVLGYADCIEELSRFRGSKYVQARVGTSFIQAKKILEDGRNVLFSGTPCQIAGLKAFLHKEYNNLLTVDFICHGTPSPFAWEKYLAEQINPVTTISFRDKHTGWKGYSITVGNNSVPYYEDSYMKAFLCNLDLRLCCSTCKFKSGRSGSDITLGDFWGVDKIKPELDNDKGISCVIANSKKGEQVCSEIDMKGAFSLDYVRKYNPSYTNPSPHNINREYFLRQLQKRNFTTAFHKSNSPTLMAKIKRKLFKIKNNQ